MGKCANCGVTLDPAWKFCVMCGTPVVMIESPPAATEVPIRAAFRPVNVALDEDLDDEAPPEKKVDLAMLFGIVMAAGGTVLILVVAIALFTPRG